MKNKKIVVCLLIAVLVLGLALTTLVGCKGFKDVAYEDMSEFLSAAITNTAESKNINDMKLGAFVTIDTSYGSSKKTYTIDLAADLSLDQTSSKTNSLSLEIKDATAGKNVLSAYYYEYDSSVNASAPIYLKLGDTDAGKFKVNAFNVKDVMKALNDGISNDEAAAINSTVVETLTGMFNTIGIITQIDGVKTQVNRKGTAYRLSLNLGGVLSSSLIDTVASGLQETIDELGIALDMKTLSQVLPALELGITVNVSSKKSENAVITGIAADLTCPKSDIVVGKKGKDASDKLVDISIANDFKLNADIQLKFGDEVQVKSETSWDAYTNTIGAINMTAKGSFSIDKDITNVSVLFLNVNVPQGDYNLEIAIAADPSKLASKDMIDKFDGIHSLPHAIDVAIDAVNAALDYLNLKITKTNGDDFLQVELKKVGNNIAVGTLNLAALGIDKNKPGIGGIIGGLSGMELSAAWNAVAPALSSFGVSIPDNLDEGYAYANGRDYKNGYKADTAKGYVDDGKGNPKKDENGNYVTGDNFALLDGKPAPKDQCGYTKNASGAWVVDTDKGYVADDDGNVKVVDGKFAVSKDFELYSGTPAVIGTKENGKEGYVKYSADGEWMLATSQGRPMAKKDCGYTADGSSVDTANGYVKSGSKVRFDNDGNFAVASGYTLVKRDGDIPRPVKDEELTTEEKEAIEEAKKEAEKDGAISDTVKDLIAGLSLVGKGGKISVTLGGLKFALDEKAADVKYINLAATLGLDKSGINVSATIKGLNEVKVEDGTNEDGSKKWTSLGLPEELTATIKINFTDIKYGNALK